MIEPFRALALDKQMHIEVGFAIALVLFILGAHPVLGAIVAFVVGLAKEYVYDAFMVWLAWRRDQLPTHTVELADAVATAVGGALALPLIFLR